MKKSIAIIENHIISTNTVRQKLTQELIAFGYNVTVLSTGSNKELELARSKGFTVIDIGTSNTRPTEVFGYMKNLRKALKEINADVCLTFTMRPAIWGNMITRLMGIPTITNITGIGPLAKSESVVYKVARILYKVVLKKTSKVFFQNKDDMNIFLDKKFVEQQQVEIIPGSGVDYNFFAPLPKKRNDDRFVFLFISRLIKDKGITEYVEAARLLKEKGIEADFQVLGPYYSQNLKENMITEKDILEWVEDGTINYLGASMDVRKFIAEADCIVLPSYREGMSNVLLEAGSMQKPAVTCDVTGCRDIVVDGETGYLCRVADAKDLAEKLEKMIALSPEDRKKMGENAREIIKTKFAKKIVVDAYLKAIEAALKK